MINKNNRIGIITLFNCYNYGAVLQAYATCKYIESLGYENVEIIDYENKYESKMKKTIPFIFSGNSKEIIKRFIQYIFLGKNRSLKKGFKEFSKELKKTEKKYKSIEDLKNTNYDILISGSDQIWNPKIFNEIDLVYFLDFAKNTKKYAISSSAGSYEYSDKEKNRIEAALKEYSGISVREESLKKQLESIRDDIFVSVDPTLLLSKEEWCTNLTTNNRYNEENSDYVLVYIVDANLKQYIQEIKELKKKIGKEIWLITPYRFKMKYIDKNIVSATPNDFISLIKNANCVITNSFHGVIFSTNFKKNFVALENHKNPVRVKDYLDKVGLESRIVKNVEDAKKIRINDNIQYYNKLEGLVNETKKWIGDQIG